MKLYFAGVLAGVMLIMVCVVILLPIAILFTCRALIGMEAIPVKLVKLHEEWKKLSET